MSWNLIAQLTPYLLGLAIPAGVGIYAFLHRDVSGAVQYGWYDMARSVWNLGLLFEFLSPTFSGKSNWLMVEAISVSATVTLIPAFIFAFTESKPQKAVRSWLALLLAPTLFVFLSVTNNLHRLVYQSSNIEVGNKYSLLYLRLMPVGWIFMIYSMVMVLFFIGLLIGKFIHAQPLYRSQAFAIGLGMILDSVGIGLAISLNMRVLIPVSSGIGSLIVAWSLFRYRLFKLRPIARDTLFGKLADMVIVLDVENRIVDINQSALKFLELTPSETIGKLAKPVFSKWPELVEKFREPSDASIEIAFRRPNTHLHFDISSTLLYNRLGNYQGRILVARNITPYASLQWKQKELNEELEKLNGELEKRVQDRTEELAQAYDTTLQGWAKALELRDKETEGHSRRVTEMTLKLARALDVAESEINDIRRGALLHDIGKMAIPDEILRKTDHLTPSERKIVKEHPLIAQKLLSPIKFLDKALEIPYCHHERWDGKGYPRGLKGEEIPLSARIFSVVDVWDALQSDRPYRKAWSVSRARAYLAGQARHIFDPNIVKVFLDLIQQGRL
jgi:putative nucleotidyltransferase with HDIG domain